MASEDELAIQCAKDQAARDLPRQEVSSAALYEKTVPSRPDPDLSYQGQRWYVELELVQDGEQWGAALYRVWHPAGEWKAMRVALEPD